MQSRISEIASGTVYRSLDFSGEQVRILSLHSGKWDDPISCSLRIVSLKEAKCGYQALSYRWGDERDAEQIFVDGDPLSVTANLHSALKHLRLSSENRDLWVDQICINQVDANEKMRQIGLMKSIYVDSAEVIIWLGDSDKHSDKLAKLLSTADLDSELMKARRTENEGAFVQDIQTLYRLILHLCLREWWSRVWVVQECALPIKPPIFQCGESCFTFSQLEEAFDLVMHASHYPISSEYISSDDDASLQRALEASLKPATDLLQPLENMITLRHTLAPKVQRTISPIDCLQLTLCRFASNRKDYVYGFLGLVSWDEIQELNLDPEASVQEVFQSFVTLALQSAAKTDKLGCYQALRSISFEVKHPTGASWVPDLAVQSFSNRNNSVYFVPAKPVETRFDPSIWFDGSIMNIVGFSLDIVTHAQYLERKHRRKLNALKSDADLEIITNTPIPPEPHLFAGAIASCQDLAIRVCKLPMSSRRRSIMSEDISMRSVGIDRVKFRRIFTCNSKFSILSDQAEILDELWDLWVRSKTRPSELSQNELRRHHRDLGVTTVESIFDEFHERSTAACEGRTWFRTQKNYLGVAIPGIRPGDVVMLPRGLVMPLVLRPHAGYYKLLGGAYVDGIFEDGVVDSLVDEGRLKEQIWRLT